MVPNGIVLPRYISTSLSGDKKPSTNILGWCLDDISTISSLTQAVHKLNRIIMFTRACFLILVEMHIHGYLSDLFIRDSIFDYMKNIIPFFCLD